MTIFRSAIAISCMAIAMLAVDSAAADAALPSTSFLGVLKPGMQSNLQATVGQLFTVRLTSNPTTGYQWSLETKDDEHFTLVNQEYQMSQAQPGMMGGGGVEVFTFRATKSGSAAIKLGYVRPWEKGTPAVATATVDIRVQG